MSNFPIFHGIALAENSWIENLNVEVLVADPVPVGPGRLWFNSTDKVFKYSGLDATGGVIVRTFKDAESAAAELASVQAAIAAEASRATAAEGVLTTDLAAEVTRAKAAEGALDAKIDATKAELLGGIPPETLDTITELAAALRDNPDIVTVLETKIGTDIAAAKAELKGTVTEAMDTLGEIETALNAETARATAAETAEAAARAAADTALDTRLTTVESATNGKIGNLATLHTDAKDTLVNAINEVQDEIVAEVARATAAEGVLTTNLAAEVARAEAAEAAEAAARTAADAQIRSDYNAKRYTFQSTVAATTHIVAHNLNAPFVDFTVLVQRPDGKYRNDVVSVEEVDANTLKVYLASAQHIKIAVTSMTGL